MSSPPNPNDLTRHQLDELDALLQRMLSLPINGAGPATSPAASFLGDVAEIPPVPAAPAGWRSDFAPAPRVPHVAVEVPAPAPAWGADPLARYGPTPATAPSSLPANFQVPTLPPPSLEIVRDRDYPDAEYSDPEPIPLFGPPGGNAEPRTLRGVDAPAVPHGFRPTVLPEPVVPAMPPLANGLVMGSAFLEAPTATGPVARERVPLVAWPLFACNWVLETALGLFGPFGRLLTNTTSKQVLGWCGVLLVGLAGAWCALGMGWVDFLLPGLGELAGNGATRR